MIKVGFYLENRDIPDVNFTSPESGNPGCGGTEFLFASLPYYLSKDQGNVCQPIFLAHQTNNLPSHIPAFGVVDVYDAVRKAKKNGCDFFVYRPKRTADQDVLDLIDTLEMHSIGWAHITPTASHIRKMKKSKYFRTLILTEREQFDQMQDSPLYSKLTFLLNIFDVDGYPLTQPPQKDPNLVIYLGALIFQKGFHVLAQAWPRVIAQFPHAKLAVIGSGALYNVSSKLGRLRIADMSYEEKYIIPYLCDTNGYPIPSVTFMGKMGVEKKELLHKALIGVVNPTGMTENCPGSALELSACETAIVSGAYYGIMDTVIDGKTGLLGRNVDDLVNNICALLENPERAKILGKNGIKFVRERYNHINVTRSWIDLFDRLKNDKPLYRPGFKKNMLRHHKLLIGANKIAQSMFGKIIQWPTISEVKESIYNMRKHAQ